MYSIYNSGGRQRLEQMYRWGKWSKYLFTFWNLVAVWQQTTNRATDASLKATEFSSTSSLPTAHLLQTGLDLLHDVEDFLVVHLLSSIPTLLLSLLYLLLSLLFLLLPFQLKTNAKDEVARSSIEHSPQRSLEEQRPTGLLSSSAKIESELSIEKIVKRNALESMHEWEVEGFRIVQNYHGNMQNVHSFFERSLTDEGSCCISERSKRI